jgi:hypothetical protein
MKGQYPATTKETWGVQSSGIQLRMNHGGWTGVSEANTASILRGKSDPNNKPEWKQVTSRIHAFSQVSCSIYECSSTLKMEAVCSSETSTAFGGRHCCIPEDSTHNHHCHNPRSYLRETILLYIMISLLDGKSQNCWVYGLCHRPEFWITGKHNILETGYVSVFRWGEVKETPTLFGPLETANLNHWTALSKGPNRVGVSSPHLKTETDPGSLNVLLSRYLEFRTVDKFHKPNDSKRYTQEPFRLY